MGAFYVNQIIKGSNRQAIAKALSGRKTFVSPELNGYVVVFDEESDSQDQEAIGRLAAKLSADLNCTVLSVLNHDSDILWYQLHEAGILTGQYDSEPNYWSLDSEISAPKGGDSERLCRVFGRENVPEVEQILRASWETYPHADKRHAELFRALNLPEISVFGGYRGIAQGYPPEGLSAEDLLATN